MDVPYAVAYGEGMGSMPNRLIAAALVGAAIAVVIGIARMVQIRSGLSDRPSRRFRLHARREEAARDDAAGTADEVASPS